MNLQKATEDYTQSRAYMNKFRRRYIALCRQAIMLDRTGKRFNQLIAKMQTFGVYSPKSLESDIAYSILRHIYKWENKIKVPFHVWCDKNGFRRIGSKIVRGQFTFKN